MQAKEEKAKAKGKTKQLGHRPTRVRGIHQSLERGLIMGGGHHCKQGGGAKSEVDGAEQVATGKAPAFLILALNISLHVPWHWIAGSIDLCIGFERGEFPGKVGDASCD